MSRKQTHPHFSIDRTTSGYLRAVSILLVILGHLLGGKYGVISTQTQALMGNGGVTIFLLLSGYGLYASWQAKGLNAKTYWSGKINRIFLPYIAVTVLYYLYLLWIGTDLGAGILLDNLLCLDFQRHMDKTMWYMSFLLIWYIVFFVLFYFDYPTPAKIGLLVVVGFAFRDYWLKDVFADCTWQFYTHAFSFPLGVLMGYGMELANRSFRDQAALPWKTAAGWILAGISLVVFILGWVEILPLDYWQYGILLFIVLYRLLRSIPKKLPVLGSIGGCSFMMYLVEEKLIAFLDRFEILNDHPWLYLPVYAVLLAATAAAYRLIEKRLNRKDKEGVK